MTAYYNEFDPNAAAWLRQLIEMDLIAPGEVDERSITDVTTADLRGFTQHHFFAGIGVWSYSLRRAGWSDDLPVCTASLPCQPFSAAGKRKGKDDERHLLPPFLNLVKECDFSIMFGEQVAPAIKQGWLDDLYDEMEQQGYTCGASVLTAAGAGAPHIRQRIYWTAFKEGLAHPNEFRQSRQGEVARPSNSETDKDWQKRGVINDGSLCSGLGDTSGIGRQQQSHGLRGDGERVESPERKQVIARKAVSDASIEWLYCRDEKYRPIKSGIAPLVARTSRGMGHSSDSSISPNETSEARVMRLKGYGNAIQADVATEFIGAVMECL